MAQRTVTYQSPGTATLLGVAFVVLKLTGVIGWSWWWVTAPFWIPPAFLLVFGAIALITYVFGGALLETRRNRKRRKALKNRYGQPRDPRPRF